MFLYLFAGLLFASSLFLLVYFGVWKSLSPAQKTILGSGGSFDELRRNDLFEGLSDSDLRQCIYYSRRKAKRFASKGATWVHDQLDSLNLESVISFLQRLQPEVREGVRLRAVCGLSQRQYILLCQVVVFCRGCVRLPSLAGNEQEGVPFHCESRFGDPV